MANAPKLSNTGRLGNIPLPPPTTLQNDKIPPQDKETAVHSLSAFDRYLTHTNPNLPNHVDATGVVSADTYKSQVILYNYLQSFQGDQPPPWYAGLAKADAIAELRDMIKALVEGSKKSDAAFSLLEGRLKGVEDTLERVEDTVKQTNLSLTRMHISMLKRQNFTVDPAELVQVPFPDGTDPWGKDVKVSVEKMHGTGRWQRTVQEMEMENLPPLNSIAAIGQLSSKQLAGYVEGYYSGLHGDALNKDKKQLVQWAVGRK
ncbi:hypothetical protein E1B28_005409 [Marasmius oreades]|uniref:Mug135-like C-terminal domain-containing protein n=1 Tax=Marasmius oreades TaxID=181124 RepID=A0A9P7S3M9_9AGAR|nr:uncharacterized protein E1B28_005409 [Marasmius oreades]KAG7094583.1 hypothetical protein E1B28_005409 [Marasmius oreades]